MTAGFSFGCGEIDASGQSQNVIRSLVSFHIEATYSDVSSKTARTGRWSDALNSSITSAFTRRNVAAGR